MLKCCNRHTERYVLSGLLLLAALALFTSACAAEPRLPDHWVSFSSRAGCYLAGRLESGVHSGEGCGRISSQLARPRDHALLYQKVSADNYLGRRLQVSGFLKAKQVKGWAGLWVRVDAADGKVLQFENMMNEPVRGTIDWKRYSVTVDVPPEAVGIHFGALLSGRGEVLVDDFDLEATGPLLPGRELKQRIRVLPAEPANLGFER